MSVITVPMPADLPTNWTTGQIISPSGTDVGLTAQHGYNYLMQQVNASQTAITEIDGILSGYVANIQTGSYIGTGVYGSSNPNSITFGFVPKIVWCGRNVFQATTFRGPSGADFGYIGMLITSFLTTSYTKDVGFGYSARNLDNRYGVFGKLSADGKTISWYSTESESTQYNESGKTYYWLAIG